MHQLTCQHNRNNKQTWYIHSWTPDYWHTPVLLFLLLKYLLLRGNTGLVDFPVAVVGFLLFAALTLIFPCLIDQNLTGTLFACWFSCWVVIALFHAKSAAAEQLFLSNHHSDGLPANIRWKEGRSFAFLSSLLPRKKRAKTCESVGCLLQGWQQGSF